MSSRRDLISHGLGRVRGTPLAKASYLWRPSKACGCAGSSGSRPLGKHHEAEPAYGSLGMAVGGVRERRRDIRPSGRVWPCRLSGRTRQQRWLPAKASWAALPSAGGGFGWRQCSIGVVQSNVVASPTTAAARWGDLPTEVTE